MPKQNHAGVQIQKAKAVLRRCRQKLYSSTELRIYSVRLRDLDGGPPPAISLSKNKWADLEAFDAQHGFVSRDAFLAEAKKRRANGEDIYTLAEGGRLIHYGWVAAPVDGRHIPDVAQFVEFPTGSAYVYDFFTHPECRNRGLYQHSLKYILKELAATPALVEVFIGVESANAPSRRAIEKAGFTYRFSLYQQWRLFRVRRWSGK